MREGTEIEAGSLEIHFDSTCSVRYHERRKRTGSDSVLMTKNDFLQKIQQPIYKDTTKHVNYTTIADRLRIVSWSNNNHPTGVDKQVYGYPTIPLMTKAVQSKGHTFNDL